MSAYDSLPAPALYQPLINGPLHWDDAVVDLVRIVTTAPGAVTLSADTLPELGTGISTEIHTALADAYPNESIQRADHELAKRLDVAQAELATATEPRYLLDVKLDWKRERKELLTGIVG